MRDNHEPTVIRFCFFPSYCELYFFGKHVVNNEKNRKICLWEMISGVERIHCTGSIITFMSPRYRFYVHVASSANTILVQANNISFLRIVGVKKKKVLCLSSSDLACSTSADQHHLHPLVRTHTRGHSPRHQRVLRHASPPAV